jgi:hypothetical protein
VTNLVIVMAGNESLHERFAKDRDFQLWVCYWGGDDEVADRYRKTCDRLISAKDEKWALLRNLRWIDDPGGDPPFSRYDYVLLLDDDLEFPGGAADISRAFNLASEIRADIFHPAVANEHYTSEVTHRLPGYLCHATNVIDQMATGYTAEVFRLCVLPALHALGHVRAGWGMQPVFAKAGEALVGRPMRIFMLDEISTIHTRPVGKGSASHQLGYDEAFLLPQAYPMMELARFCDAAEAARYEFPFLEMTADLTDRDRKLALIRRARVLIRMSMQKRLLGRMIRRRLRRYGIETAFPP